MASGPSTSSSASAIPTLVPQGQHTGKPAMPMGRPFTLVGSRHRAHLHLLSRSVSKSHAIIVNDHGSLYVRDTASREHVYVNGEAVKEAELRNGDVLRIGTFTFKLVDSSGKSGRKMVARPTSAAIELPGATLPTLIEGRTLLIGRRSTCDIVLGELAVSNMHAVIFELDGHHYIRDLGSRTGTFVNGQPIHHQSLKYDDQIRVGDHEMRFVPGGVESSVDELEHLVGTATLGSEQMILASADAARAAANETAHAQETIPLAGDDDIIPLRKEVAEDERPLLPAAAAVTASESTIIPESTADLAELDLNSDPDVSGSGDTRAMPLESPSDTPRMPVLSSQVVDDPQVSDEVAIDSVLGDEVGIESDERHLLVGGDLGDDHLTASGSFANVAHHEDDEDLAANTDFDLTDYSHESPVDKHVDTMYFDPEPARAAADSQPDANTPATAQTPDGMQVVPPVDHLTASAHDTADVEAASIPQADILQAVGDETGALPLADKVPPLALADEVPPTTQGVDAAPTDETARETAASVDQPDMLAAAPPVEQVLAATPDPLSTEDLADRYLAAPLVPDAMGIEPVESATADSSFAQPAVLHGPESAGFAEGSHETFQHETAAPSSETWTDESSGQDEPLLPEEQHALMPDASNGHERSESAVDPFGGEVPPPFPAGLAPVIANGAVGLPSWTSVRAETSRARRPIADTDANDEASNRSADSGGEAREVFDRTDPTPESAQHLEVQIGDTWAETYADLMPGTEELSDSQFGVVVQDFAGSSLGSLVENAAGPGVVSPRAELLATDPVLDQRQVSAAPPPDLALTSHDSLQIEPDIAPQAAPPVDSTGDSADAPSMGRVVDESSADVEAMLAAEGFLPESTGDDLVDQAMAFLTHDSEPAPLSTPDAQGASLAAEEHPPLAAPESAAHDTPAQESSHKESPARESVAEESVPVASPTELQEWLAEGARSTVPDGQATADQPPHAGYEAANEAVPPPSSDASPAMDDLGLEFEDLTIEEMFAPIAVEMPESPLAAAGNESADEPAEGLLFDEAPPATTAEMPDTFSAPQMDLEEAAPLPPVNDTPAAETEIAATAAEDLVLPEASATGDMIALPRDATETAAQSIEPGGDQEASSAAAEAPDLRIEQVEMPESAAQPPLPPAAPTPQSNMQLLMGMSRDFGSFLGGMPLSLPPVANKPPPPVARPKAAPLFGETPVASMFREDAPGTMRPAPQPIPPAAAPAAPVARDTWTVLPHPAATDQTKFAAPAPVEAPARVAPAAPVDVNPMAAPPAPVDAGPAEEELEELPDILELDQVEPEMPESSLAEPELAGLPEIEPVISELPEPQPELAESPVIEPEVEQEIEPMPELAELPEPQAELAESPELEFAPAPAAAPEILELSELPDEPSALAASPTIADSLSAEPELAEPELEELPEIAELPEAAPNEKIAPGSVVDEAPAALFDATPEALDELPETMERIADVTEAVGEKPELPAANAPVSPAARPAESAPAPVVRAAGAALGAAAGAAAHAASAALPAAAVAAAATAAVARAASAKSPARPNAAGQSAADPVADAPAKPKRVTPPPMARSIRRSTGPSQAGGLVGGAGAGNPMMPSVDIFSQHQPVMPDAFGAPQIPPSGFIPPTTGTGRRPRSAAISPAGKKPGEVPPAPRKPSAAAQKIPIDPGSVLRMPPASTSQFGRPTPARPAAGAGAKPVQPGNAPAAAQKPRSARKPAVVETLYNVEEDFSAEAEQVGQADGSPDSRSDDSGRQPRTKEPRDLSPAPGRRKSRKWRFPFFGLLALAAVSGAGAAGAWYGMPVNSTIKAGLRFENLDQQPTSFLIDFNTTRRKEMEGDAFRQSAQQIYEIAFHGHAGNDFLYRQGDFLTVVEGAKINGDHLVFVKDSHDPDGDRVRFQAVLKALYTVDQKMRDDAATQRIALENARKEYARLEQSLADLRARIDDGQKRQADFELARKTEKDISDQAAALEKAWSDATAATRKAKSSLDLLEAAQGGANAAIDGDAQLQQMTQRLKALNDALGAAQGTHSGDARAAASAFDGALSAYKAEIERVKTASGDASPLVGYIAVAQQVEEAIRQINADLADRQKTSQQTIADLNRKLADKIEQHLKRTWGADENLRKNSQDLGIYQHQLGAVTGAGLTDEAARIRVLVDTFQKAVDARRNQLAAPSLYPADITAMQQLVADQTEQMRGEQSRADQRMSEQFKLLSSARPEVSTLSDEQQTYLNGLVEKLTAVGTARQHLVAAQMPGGGADVKSLETETTALAAQIEARRREIADARKNATPAADSPDIVQARAAIDAAQQADAAAFTEWTASKAKLSDAQAALDKMQSNQPDLVRDLAVQASSQARHDELKTQIDRDAAMIPVMPIDPDHEDGVQVTRLSGDYRLFAMGGIAAFFAVSSLLLIGRSRRRISPRMTRKEMADPPEDQEESSVGHHPLTAA